MIEMSSATERYLRTIFDLDEDHVTPRRARISARLGHSKSAVSQKIERMRLGGLVQMTDDQRIVLTDAGHRTAVALTRKHRLAERMLVDIIGMRRADVHQIATRWEHVMDDDVERHLVPLLGYPATDPWGNPIPGLEQIGFNTAPKNFSTPVPELPLGIPTSGVIRRFTEHMQNDRDALAGLLAEGIEPGMEVTVTPKRRSVLLATSRSTAELPTSIACAIHVDTARRHY
ncbi:metal-dependent transcriptional regulator [Gordonia insulae]|uniref:Iron-dependent repressor IdeR n=1 Tax=Gordonia insulae TaxID=2420509 RepID=A0A3G8JQ23_9ACTN|nr:metal-dependent transcriptional regulator [Gordonia insulae]AZG46250.1 Iron-dependent repressor IdeR [Gordonia insulae]